jgi:RecG-like helicase
MKELLEPLGISVVLVSGGGRAAARKAVREQVASGAAQVVIGTHAVIQQGVTFAKLGLAVVDEQHRFGVLQRKTLIEKGYKPDVLVLTATPIPRTLAMTVYGDLDVSVIDTMPPGRKPVRTFLFSESQRGPIRFSAMNCGAAVRPMWCIRSSKNRRRPICRRPSKVLSSCKRKSWPSFASGYCTVG